MIWIVKVSFPVPSLSSGEEGEGEEDKQLRQRSSASQPEPEGTEKQEEKEKEDEEELELKLAELKAQEMVELKRSVWDGYGSYLPPPLSCSLESQKTPKRSRTRMCWRVGIVTFSITSFKPV